MSQHISRDEAESLATQARSPQRRKLLGMGLAAGGAALAFGTMGTGTAKADIVDFLDRLLDLDPIVINFAYELEELQTDFFERAALSRGFGQLSSREQSTFNLIAKQDRQQFEKLGKLREKLGVKSGDRFEAPNAASSRRPRSYNFGGAFNSRDELMKTAIEIKRLSVASYHGAVNNVDRGNLTLAAAIAGTDGRHLVVLRELAGLDPVPTSFEEAISPQDTGRMLGKYGFNGGGFRNGY